MSDFDPKLNNESQEPQQEGQEPQQQEEEKVPFTPARFEKRVAAWMGIAYMLLIMFAVTFSIYSGGRTLPGTFPLFLVPVAVAAIVVTVYRQRQGTAPGGLGLTVVIVLICIAAAVLGLLMGIPALVGGVQAAMR